MSEPRICTNCQAPITTTGGRPPADGRWYCERRPCAAARARHRRAQKSGVDPQRMEDRPCFFCHTPMHSRPWRTTDLELGRWCRKTVCQEIKGEIVDALAAQDGEWVTEIFLRARKMGRIECRDCGSKDAVRGFPHPKPGTSVRGGDIEVCRAISPFAYVSDGAILYTWPWAISASDEQEQSVKATLQFNRDQEEGERRAKNLRAERERERRRGTRSRRRS